MEETRFCTKCKEDKPLSEFGLNNSRKDGLQRYCKDCCREYGISWRQRNREKTREDAARWYGENRERILASRAENTLQQYNCHIQRTYGITISDYDEILEEQSGGCAICGRTPEENGKKLFVDHDHETGEVRGLLCNRCNRCIGSFHDDQYLLRSAANYIEKFK